MKDDKTDRRSQRTRDLLQAALVDLLLEKKFDRITVQDLLDRANIGRSTFYEHYTSKEDLLFTTLRRVFDSLNQSLPDEPELAHPLLPSLALFRHIQGHRRLYHALMWGQSSELIVTTLQTQLANMVENNLARWARADDAPTVPHPVLAQFVAGAFLALLRWWLTGHNTYSPEQIDAMFTQMTYPGVYAALGLGPEGDR